MNDVEHDTGNIGEYIYGIEWCVMSVLHLVDGWCIFALGKVSEWR